MCVYVCVMEGWMKGRWARPTSTSFLCLVTSWRGALPHLICFIISLDLSVGWPPFTSPHRPRTLPTVAPNSPSNPPPCLPLCLAEVSDVVTVRPRQLSLSLRHPLINLNDSGWLWILSVTSPLWHLCWPLLCWSVWLLVQVTDWTKRILEWKIVTWIYWHTVWKLVCH